MTAQDLANGILKPRVATLAREYATFEQAIPYFLTLVNVKEGVKEHFERYFQMNLPFQHEETTEPS